MMFIMLMMMTLMISGQSKGVAFVDFEDELSAATALVKTDGTQMGDRWG